MSSLPPPNEALAELSSALGDDSARELAQMYMDNFPILLAELSNGDREQRRRAAHSLKSSSTIVGADKLSSQMAVLEARLTTANAEVTAADLAATVAEFEHVAISLKAYCRGSAGGPPA
ncbi:MAG: hypothetical protein JWM32_1229 [Verrucomicrobia bacterium]|nr:hypothetical protein [Verrucomicrobiota bacterium]